MKKESSNQISQTLNEIFKIIHYSPEMIGVISGIKPVTKLNLPANKYLQFKKILKEKYNLYCIPVYDGTTSQMKSGGNRIALYVSKSKELANKAKHYESVKDEVRLGNVLGYPECCTNFYERCEVAHLRGNMSTLITHPDFHILSYKNSKEFIFYTNNLLRKCSNYYLISHFPCSYSCKASIRYAKKLLRAIRESKPLFAEKIEKVLKLPILYWPYGKIILFEGYRKGNMISYSKVEKITDLLRRDPFDEGNRVRVTDRVIEVFKEDKKIFGINKENKYDGVIFNFS